MGDDYEAAQAAYDSGGRIQDILPTNWPLTPVQSMEVVLVGQQGAWADLEHLGGQETVRQAFIAANQALADGMTRNQAEALAAMAARAIDRHDAIRDRYGDDDMLDGAVLRFMRTLGGRVYGYAAIRAGGLWFLTGRRSPERLSWDQLTQWLDEAEVMSVERLSTGFGPEDDDEEDRVTRSDPDYYRSPEA